MNGSWVYIHSGIVHVLAKDERHRAVMRCCTGPRTTPRAVRLLAARAPPAEELCRGESTG